MVIGRNNHHRLWLRAHSGRISDGLVLYRQHAMPLFLTLKQFLLSDDWRLTRASINGHRFVEVTYAKEALFYQSSRQHNIRHVACTTHPKGYFAMRITRYPNSDLTSRLQRLLSCGDVSTNPGPVRAFYSISNPWKIFLAFFCIF